MWSSFPRHKETKIKPCNCANWSCLQSSWIGGHLSRGHASRRTFPFLSKGAILTWAGGGGGRPSLAPGEEWLLRISPPQNGGIGGTMALWSARWGGPVDQAQRLGQIAAKMSWAWGRVTERCKVRRPCWPGSNIGPKCRRLTWATLTSNFFDALATPMAGLFTRCLLKMLNLEWSPLMIPNSAATPQSSR